MTEVSAIELTAKLVEIILQIFGLDVMMYIQDQLIYSWSRNHWQERDMFKITDRKTKRDWAVLFKRLVYGTINLTYLGIFDVSSSHDDYDFDIRAWEYSTGNVIRNIETVIGNRVAGESTGYRL